MARHDAVGHRQPEPGPLWALGREERIEDFLPHLGRHADAGVGDHDLHALVDQRGGQRQRAAVGHGVERVEDEVGHRLLLPAQLGDVERAPHDLVDVERHQRLVAPDPRELLQPAHGLRAVERRPLDDLQPLA